MVERTYALDALPKEMIVCDVVLYDASMAGGRHEHAQASPGAAHTITAAAHDIIPRRI